MCQDSPSRVRVEGTVGVGLAPLKLGGGFGAHRDSHMWTHMWSMYTSQLRWALTPPQVVASVVYAAGPQISPPPADYPQGPWGCMLAHTLSPSAGLVPSSQSGLGRNLHPVSVQNMYKWTLFPHCSPPPPPISQYRLTLGVTQTHL